MIEENALNIYTDGSSYSKPRRGGYGIRIIYVDDQGKEKIEDIPIFKSFAGATNNQMELLACVTAIEESKKSKYYSKVRKINIFTDSMYISQHYNTAIFRWSVNKWMTKDNNPVANAEIWKKLVRVIKKSNKRIDIKWVKGHSKDEHNRRVDQLAKQSAKSSLKATPLSVVNVRRKKTNKAVNRGCVVMKGQRISIRIITDEYLRTQKINKYRYEIISKGSKYYGLVDFIFSKINLKAGHEYVVTFNTCPKSPRILKLIHEIDKKTI